MPVFKQYTESSYKWGIWKASESLEELLALLPHKEKYEAIYIGQSLHLASRVKQHLQGNGNKKVYYDYQNRKQIYIHLERCMPSYMNRMEKDLIRSFKATRSYNIQKGGGKHRQNKENFKYK